MKRNFLSVAGAVALIVSAFSTSAQAQPSQPSLLSQTELIEAKDEYYMKHYSLYKEYYDDESYEEAMGSWRVLYTLYPMSSKNIYLHGVKLIQTQIGKATDEQKPLWVDTLMAVYEQRIKYFEQEGFLRGSQGYDLLRYNPQRYKDAYNYFQRSYALDKSEMNGGYVAIWMQASFICQQRGEISNEQFLNDYMVSIDILNYQLQKETDAQMKEKIKTYIGNANGFLEKSGVATCEALNEVFAPKFAANPTDLALLKNMTALMERTTFADGRSCRSCDLYAQASVKLYDVEPSAAAAVNLARLFMQQEKYAEAKGFYEKAVAYEGLEATAHAQYYFELATACKVLGQVGDARAYARKAIERNPNWGEPYILIGDLYASSQCGEGEAAKFVYIAAVDQYNRAASVDPDENVKSKARQRASQNSSRFPRREQAFFEGLEEGQTKTVGCWIGETITVRFAD